MTTPAHLEYHRCELRDVRKSLTLIDWDPLAWNQPHKQKPTASAVLRLLPQHTQAQIKYQTTTSDCPILSSFQRKNFFLVKHSHCLLNTCGKQWFLLQLSQQVLCSTWNLVTQRAGYNCWGDARNSSIFSSSQEVLLQYFENWTHYLTPIIFSRLHFRDGISGKSFTSLFWTCKMHLKNKTGLQTLTSRNKYG